MILYESIAESKPDEFASWVKARIRAKAETKPKHRKTLKDISTDVTSIKMWTKNVKETLARLDTLKKESPENAGKIEEIKAEIREWQKSPSYRGFKGFKQKKKRVMSILKKLGIGLALGILVIAAIFGTDSISESVLDLEDLNEDDVTVEYSANKTIIRLLGGEPVRQVVED